MDALVEKGETATCPINGMPLTATDANVTREESVDDDDVVDDVLPSRVSSGLHRLQRGLQRSSGSRHGSQNSLKHCLTNEVVPHVDHYRNRQSLATEPSSSRPTLAELLSRQSRRRRSSSRSTSSRRFRTASKLPVISNNEAPKTNLKEPIKFGWVVGVYLPCLLNIWGVMLFLRLPWVVGQAGLIEALGIIVMANCVTFLTAISMSAVCTNGKIRGGGIYFMISRSLGPEFGGAVGIMFTVANAVATAVYVIGFCESFVDMLDQYYPAFDSMLNLGRLNDIRLMGAITMVVILLVALIGMDWVNRVQLLLLILLLVAQLDFVIGVLMPNKSEIRRSMGIFGLDLNVLRSNLWSNYSLDETSTNVRYNAISVFAIFFPAATGICAGANMSGDLIDPAQAIPKGTLAAIITTFVSYILYAVLTAASTLRFATGDVEDANLQVEEMLSKCHDCEYGTASHQQMMQLMSAWGPLIYAGCFAATLSSAMGALVGGPRVFQAVAEDKLFPFISTFGQGYGRNNEPFKGYLLTFAISLGCVLMGDLNRVSSLLSNFFVATYALINYAVFHASFNASPGWRPSFKYSNKWLALLGTVLCSLCMLAMDILTALITLIVALLLYVFVRTRHVSVNWGSSMQAESFLNALRSVHALNKVEDHIKNYRPKLIVLTGLPSDRPTLVDLAHLITRRDSFLQLVHIVRRDSDLKAVKSMYEASHIWLRANRIKAFFSINRNTDIVEGLRNCLELSGLGKLSPNTLLMGFMETWWSDNKRAEEYLECLRSALNFNLGLAILRVSGGLDVAEMDGVKERLQQETRKMARSPSNTSLDDQGIDNELVIATEEPNKEQMEGDVVNKDPREAENLRVYDVLRQTPSTSSTLSSTQRRLDSGNPIDAAMLRRLMQFRMKATQNIDVYWLYDDGGLTLLMAHILSSRSIFSKCGLRVFFLSKRSRVEQASANMAALLSRFRIPVDHLLPLEGATVAPGKETLEQFQQMLLEQGRRDVEKLHTWTSFQLRIAEMVRVRSSDASLIVMTLPLPPKQCDAIYLATLDFTSRNMPPVLFIRGNQQAVLTFYS